MTSSNAAQVSRIRAGFVLVVESLAKAPAYFSSGSKDGLWGLVIEETAKADTVHAVGWHITPDRATRLFVFTGYNFDQGVTLEMINERKYL